MNSSKNAGSNTKMCGTLVLYTSKTATTARIDQAAVCLPMLLERLGLPQCQGELWGCCPFREEAESVSGQSHGQQQKRDVHNQLRKNHKKMHMEVQVQENRNCKSRIEFLQRLLVFKNQSEEKMRVVSPFSPVDRMTCCGGLLALCLFLCVSLLCVKVRSSSCRSPW